MKKLICLVAVLAVALTLLAGCNTNTPSTNASDTNTPAPAATPNNTAPAPETTNPVELSGTVSTNGSTSVDKVMGSLIEAFTAENKNVTVTYDATGSGAGITASADGTADIGLSSRGLKDSETGLDGTVFALDGIAIIVNPTNPVSDLTIEQIAGLATGEITNWKEVGGNDAPVAVIGREAGSGTRDGFESIIGVAEKCVYDQELTSTGAVITAVASNEYAIGYASLSAVGDTTKTLMVGGIRCAEETVLDGTYAVQRPFVFVTNSDKKLSAAARAFIDFALSDSATDIISNAGAVQPR